MSVKLKKEKDHLKHMLYQIIYGHAYVTDKILSHIFYSQYNFSRFFIFGNYFLKIIY